MKTAKELRIVVDEVNAKFKAEAERLIEETNSFEFCEKFIAKELERSAESGEDTIWIHLGTKDDKVYMIEDYFSFDLDLDHPMNLKAIEAYLESYGYVVGEEDVKHLRENLAMIMIFIPEKEGE